MTLVDKILKTRDAIRDAKKNGRAHVPPEELEEVEELFDEEDPQKVFDATMAIVRAEQEICRDKACKAIDRLREDD